MQSLANPIQEWSNVDTTLFHKEILPRQQPAVLRGAVHQWPMVQAALSSTEDAVDYLIEMDNHAPVYTIVGEPEIKGRFFYSDDLKGVNFKRLQASLTASLEQLLGLRNNPNPHAVAIQAADVRSTLTGFDAANAMPLLEPSIAPTLWLGNRAVVAPHYDVHDNLACVTAGRRRFTLFPPEQVANLYVGPTLNSPGGVPISLVNLRDPDYERFPKYADALSVAQEAVLEPGDAIFIPMPWWHAVESLDDINVLINYWWGGLGHGTLSPNNSLVHSMLTIAKLSPEQRMSWRHFFDYFVFKKSGDPSAHLPDALEDIATTLSPQQQRTLYEFLKSRLE